MALQFRPGRRSTYQLVFEYKFGVIQSGYRASRLYGDGYWGSSLPLKRKHTELVTSLRIRVKGLTEVWATGIAWCDGVFWHILWHIEPCIQLGLGMMDLLVKDTMKVVLVVGNYYGGSYPTF